MGNLWSNLRYSPYAGRTVTLRNGRSGSPAPAGRRPARSVPEEFADFTGYHREMDSSRRIFLATLGGAPALAQTARREPKLAYRTLGMTGLKVTTLGFGTMLASDPLVVERAADMGITCFDSARSYQGGNNERMVGAALKGKRQRVVLASKTLAATREGALRDLDTSLREIGTDYLDLWYMHAKGRPEEVTDELLEAQQAAKKAGKIRFAGVSTHANMKGLLAWLVEKRLTDVILTSYNFYLSEDISGAIRAARKAGVGIVAMKVMAGGYARIRRGDRLYGQHPNTLLGRLEKPGAMLAALKWAVRNESVDTAIVGITDFDELEENTRAMAEPFREADASLLGL